MKYDNTILDVIAAGHIKVDRKRGIVRYSDGVPVCTCTSLGYFIASVRSCPGISRRFSVAVHRIIAVSCKKKPDNYQELNVNHIDGNKKNNKASNLEFVTQKENVDHARRIGLSHNFCQTHGGAKLTNATVKRLMLSEKTTVELTSEFGLSVKMVDRIKNGHGWAEVYAEVRKLPEFKTLKERRRIHAFWINNTITKKQALQILRSTKSNLYFAEKFNLDPLHIWKVRKGSLWKWFRVSIGATDLVYDGMLERLSTSTIKKVYSANGWYMDIAEKFSLDPEQVRMIRVGKNYKNVTSGIKPGKEIYTGNHGNGGKHGNIKRM